MSKASEVKKLVMVLAISVLVISASEKVFEMILN